MVDPGTWVKFGWKEGIFQVTADDKVRGEVLQVRFIVWIVI